MLINEIKLKNFTVFEELNLDISANINIFIGENGTGKTNLLKAIYAACLISLNRSTSADILKKCFKSEGFLFLSKNKKNKVVDIFLKDNSKELKLPT